LLGYRSHWGRDVNASGEGNYRVVVVIYIL
jgi:hypothetical protein